MKTNSAAKLKWVIEFKRLVKEGPYFICDTCHRNLYNKDKSKSLR